ncbi:hypothetical protein [Kitasatospora sp. NPDC047058]|uniref:hypothetical protein n=1 Tax=Kitasatospora sp. NPDC047058 TaxID=3155620 RepID=UPI0033E2D48A
MTTTSGWPAGRAAGGRGAPRWVGDGSGPAVWGVAYAGFGAGCAGTGTALSGAAWTGWLVAGVGAAAALAGAAVRAREPRPVLRRVLGPVLWALCAAAVAGAFGLLMDVITLIVNQGVDSGPGAAQHALSALGAVLLAAAARTGRAGARTAADGPPRVGPPPAPTAAPGQVRLVALAGTLAFVPYVWMKTTWALGGTFAGLSGDRILADAEREGASGLWLTLQSWGLDVTALLAALGVFLLWGLVRPWGLVFPRWTLLLSGRRVPRWLPLTPALLGAATLAPYGIFGIGYAGLATMGVVTVQRGSFPTEADVLLVCWIGLGAFAVFGVALAVAARSYWRRSA